VVPERVPACGTPAMPMGPAAEQYCCQNAYNCRCMINDAMHADPAEAGDASTGHENRESRKSHESRGSLRLLHICRALPDHEIGGMQGHAWDLVRALAGRGHDVSVLTTAMEPGSTTDRTMVKEGVKCNFLARTHPMRYSREFRRETSRALEEMHAGKGGEGFDLVHSQSGGALGPVRSGLLDRLGLPLVVTQHGTHRDEIASRLAGASLADPRNWAWAQWSRVRMGWNGRTSGRAYLRRAARVICVSEQLAAQVIEEYGIDSSRVVMIPNSLDTDRFHPGEPDRSLMAELGLDPELPVVLFLGRMEMEKGPEVLLRAWAELCGGPGSGSRSPGAQLLMVGRGSALENIRNAVRERGLRNVVITGLVSGKKLAACYRLSDIFCFPTLRREGLPFNVLEAMASGLPVVTSPMGGIPTAVDDTVGRLVEPEPSKLADTLVGLLEDEALCGRLGRAGRERILARYSLESMVDATLEVYREVLEST